MSSRVSVVPGTFVEPSPPPRGVERLLAVFVGVVAVVVQRMGYFVDYYGLPACSSDWSKAVGVGVVVVALVGGLSG